MNKEERIKRYGEAVYEKRLQQTRDWQVQHLGKVKVNGQEQYHNSCRFYDKRLEYNKTGLRGERNRIRTKHRCLYRSFKQIIAPDSQIHHEWIPETAKYRGIALVETDQHMHGYVDVIKILEGKITLLTEKEIMQQTSKNTTREIQQV